jgi:hypothetical protein
MRVIDLWHAAPRDPHRRHRRSLLSGGTRGAVRALTPLRPLRTAPANEANLKSGRHAGEALSVSMGGKLPFRARSAVTFQLLS